MKKRFLIIFLLFIFFNMLTISTMAAPRDLPEGVYDTTSLNLSSNASHTIKNNSTTESAFMMIFDSNQIAQQLMELVPNSKEYTLVPLQPGYQMLIVTNEAVTIN